MPINIDHTGNLILTSDSLLTFEMTGSVRLPTGTTAQRPLTPTAGMIRYNTSLGTFEGYTSSWGPIGGGGGALDDLSDVVITSASSGEILRFNGTNWVDAILSTTDVTEGTNLYYTDERVDDRVSNLLVAGANITLTYDDVANTLTISSSGGGSASVATSDTPPVGPADGDLWFDTDDARLYIYYDDGSSAQWVNVVASPISNPFIDDGVTVSYDGALPVTIASTLDVGGPAGITRGSVRALGGFYDYGSSGNGGYGGFSAALTTGGAEFEAYGGDPAADAFIEFNARDTTSGNVQVRLFRNTNTSGAVSFSILRGDNTTTASHSFSRANVNLLQSDGGFMLVGLPVGATTGVIRTLGGVYDYASSGNGGYAGFQSALSTGGASFRAFSGAGTTNTFVDFDAPALTTGNFQARFFRNTNTSGVTEVLYYLGDGTSTLAHAFRDTNANLAIQAGGKVAIGKSGSPSVTLDIEGTDAVKIPVGTTAQRPTPVNGMIRYNSDLNTFEGYADSQWQSITTPDYTTNRVINGTMRIAQRGSGPFTVSNVYTLDQWSKVHVTGTQTVTREVFALGTELGKNQPVAYLRSVTASQSGATAVGVVRQRIESVRSYQNKTVTVMGWARRATAGDFAIEISQQFGTGGSPSAVVLATPVTVTAGTDWAPFAAVITLPSITGKTLGTNANDHLDLIFWQSAGSDWASRTNSLGPQNTTLELYGIHIVEGAHSAVTASQFYIEPKIEDELTKCQRYYETGRLFIQGSHTTNQAMGVGASMLVPKRGTVTFGLSVAAQGNLIAGPDVQNQGTNNVGFNATFSAAASSFAFIDWTASAEL
jgi:hypothetical protein